MEIARVPIFYSHHISEHLTMNMELKDPWPRKQSTFSSADYALALFFFFFIYFYQLEANYFTTFQWVLSYIDMNQPWSYMYSPSQSPHPPPSPTRFLWVFPVHQAWVLVSCIQPGLVIWFTIDNIHAVLSKHPTLAFSHRIQKCVLYICVSFPVLHIGLSLPSF